MAQTTYLADQVVSDAQIQEWVETFNQKGCLFLQNVLTPEHCAQLRQDLEWALQNDPNNLKRWKSSGSHALEPSDV